jgi:hypothetical protein
MPTGKGIAANEEDIMGEQLKDGLGQAWNLVATFVPKLIGFLIILLIGWLIGRPSTGR